MVIKTLYFVLIFGNISSASVKSFIGGSASVQDSRTAALPSEDCQCMFSIPYIRIDNHGILNIVIIYLVSIGNLVPLRMDVGDGKPG